MRTQDAPPAAHPVVKAILPGRDRLQSRLLVLFGIPVLCFVAWEGVRYTTAAGPSGGIYLTVAFAASLFLGLAAWRLRAATPAAAACGALICFDLTVLTGNPKGGSVFHSGLSPLICLFVLTHAATRFHRRRKPMTSDEEQRRGRNAAQVIANLGIAAVAGLQYYWVYRGAPQSQIGMAAFPALQVPMLSALAEATADTVSSEIGQAVGGTPFLLLGFRRVPPGTDGGVSAIGTLTGIAAAFGIGLIGSPALGMSTRQVAHVVIAAAAGLFFDSLLGATVERHGWIGNDAVNFASTCFAAVIAIFLNRAVFG
ncbi:MAG TPA: DUF92 domain-containing protein [Acidobacteriaceae bacterium]|nr:DUF92 domain-containing protein [Acidobacteriaceae bacterium]